MQANTSNNIDDAIKQAVAQEFNGMNHRELMQKYRISMRDIYVSIRVIQADHCQACRQSAVTALRSALSSLVDPGLHQYLPDNQLGALVRLLDALGEIDAAQRLRSLYLSRRQYCGGVQGHPDMAPRLRRALGIPGLGVCLRWLAVLWFRARSWALFKGWLNA
ncbi:hypothetical protein B0F88_10387 [Methylobacter tundripaludum]|uniref:Uncharacterized protein n=1 Tax=Methylobacter tundripaludum TaxID=173365 RepID=A0A2S6H5B6_9GAMM|nr:hypothetical protein [Methylobacter tundripaludum]PPK72654.1 hypothetical protein B0F88_10387 [Methylobacter tundripaludum]